MKNFTMHQEALDYLKGTRLLAGKFDAGFLNRMPLPSGVPQRIKVIVSPIAWVKMQLLIQGFSTEVGWQGTCVRDPEEETTFRLEDVMVYPQKVTGANITTDETKHGEWLDQFPTETFRKIRFHGHSHVDMGVFSSSTDDDLQFDKIKMLQPGDFYLFFIMNKKGDLFIRLYDNKFGVMYETADVDVVIGDGFQPGEFMKSAREMVTQAYATYKTPTYGGGQYPKTGSYTPPAPAAKTGSQPSKEKWSKELYDESPYEDRYDADDDPSGYYDQGGRWVSCAGRGA